MRPHRRRIGRLLLAAGFVVAAAAAVLWVLRRREPAAPRELVPVPAPSIALPSAPTEVLAIAGPEPVDSPPPDTERAPEIDAGPSVRARRSRRRRAFAVHLVDGLTIFTATTVMWLAVYAFAPRLIGWQPRSVISGSMAPSIRPGDVVVVRPGGASLGPGLLVTFNDPAQPGRVLTHRIIQLNDDGTWTTKGDANRQADTTPLDPDAVIGQPRLVVPLIGLPAYWRTQGGVPVSAIVVGCIVVGLVIARGVVRRMGFPDEPDRVTSVHIPAQRGEQPATSDASAKEEPWESASASS